MLALQPSFFHNLLKLVIHSFSCGSKDSPSHPNVTRQARPPQRPWLGGRHAGGCFLVLPWAGCVGPTVAQHIIFPWSVFHEVNQSL